MRELQGSEAASWRSQGGGSAAKAMTKVKCEHGIVASLLRRRVRDTASEFSPLLLWEEREAAKTTAVSTVHSIQITMLCHV